MGNEVEKKGKQNKTKQNNKRSGGEGYGHLGVWSFLCCHLWPLLPGICYGQLILITHVPSIDGSGRCRLHRILQVMARPLKCQAKKSQIWGQEYEEAASTKFLICDTVLEEAAMNSMERKCSKFFVVRTIGNVQSVRGDVCFLRVGERLGGMSLLYKKMTAASLEFMRRNGQKWTLFVSGYFFHVRDALG